MNKHVTNATNVLAVKWTVITYLSSDTFILCQLPLLKYCFRFMGAVKLIPHPLSYLEFK
jgi:hypothetical protein